MHQKVSVVVPIYQVEKYIHRCMNSIINQSYRNLEIILVNDGSPDDCGEISEHYARIDSRIKVIHKENGGLSDARNVGLEYVTGDYTIFVDSDDWLDVKIIEIMIKKSIEHKADVVQSAFFYAHNDTLFYDNRFFSKDDSPIILDNSSLMKELVKNEKIKNFAWGKIYKTNLIKDIPFQKGVLFEDVFWAHKVMHRVKKYVILHQPMYYYFQRDDSIVANYTTRNLDILEGLKVRHRFVEEFYPDLINESYKVILKMNLIHYNLLLANRKLDKDGLFRKEIGLYIKDNFSYFKKAIRNDKELKKQLHFFIISPYLNILFLIVRKVFRKLKILPQPLGLEHINLKRKGRYLYK
jgi:glycosyltransferase involved in cell wall biosynthesis